MHVIAGIAVMLKELENDRHGILSKQIVANAGALQEELGKVGIHTFSDRTVENHCLLLKVTSEHCRNGLVYAEALNQCLIETNQNSLPNDKELGFTPREPGGLRVGTVSISQCGMSKPEMAQIAQFMQRVRGNIGNDAELKAIRGEVGEFMEPWVPPALESFRDAALPELLEALA